MQPTNCCLEPATFSALLVWLGVCVPLPHGNNERFSSAQAALLYVHKSKKKKHLPIELADRESRGRAVVRMPHATLTHLVAILKSSMLMYVLARSKPDVANEINGLFCYAQSNSEFRSAAYSRAITTTTTVTSLPSRTDGKLNALICPRKTNHSGPPPIPVRGIPFQP